ncbi:hypothetical protein ACFLW2_03475 [Chloroflexota bacterium]
MRKLSILLLILLSLLLVPGGIGCDEDENPSQVDEIIKDENPPQVDEIVKDGILIRLTTDKTNYEPGENVQIIVYMENQSSEAIEYKYIEHHIYLTVRFSELNY